jgi:ribosome maturation factor RimP
MAGGKVVQAVEKIVAPIIEGLGIELVEVEYVKEGPNWYLRLYIDKPGGISIDDCQMVNDSVSDAIDAEDPIQGAYIFEVSSPGLDRPLKTDRDFEKYKGELVEISLYKAENGASKYEGTLVGKQEGKIIIEDAKGLPITFEESLVALVKRVIQF